MSPGPSFDICVRGAGAVALTAALCLGRRGLSVALLPAPPDVGAEAGRRADVRAYALNAASVALLQSLRVWEALPADARTPVLDMRVEGGAPGAVLQFSAWQDAVEALAWIVDAAELETALHAAVRFAPHVHGI
ncbi:MAG: 2-octaprenyl-3-methyl-6-methoxy-1,4-benzoquinol hydroxylase, partial [Rubrivivax sp.]